VGFEVEGVHTLNAQSDGLTSLIFYVLSNLEKFVLLP